MAENLYCPRCGKQFSGEISYCRTCGLSLDGVSEIVGGEAASASITTSRPNFRAMRLGMGIFILGLAIGLINAAVRDLSLFPESYGKMIFLALIAAGLMTIGAVFVFSTKKYTKRKPSQSTTQSDSDVKLDTAPLAGQLNAAQAGVVDIVFPKDGLEFEKIPAGSVTEQTTRNLDKQPD